MTLTKHLTRHSVLLLILVGMFSFAFAQESQDQITLSESTGDSFDLHTATYREHVYVMWQDDTLKQDEIFFRASHDNGKTFDDTTNISRTKGDSIHPKLYSQDSHVYALWVEPQDSDAKLVLRASSNFGKTFADPIILADKIAQDGSDAFAAATFDNNLYVVWLENSDSSFPKMILRSSADHGKTFSDQTYLSGANNILLTESEYPQLVISKNNLYVSWTGQDASGHMGVFFAKIDNDSMGKVSQLSPTGEDFSLDHIVASEDDVYVLMQKQVNIKTAYSEIDQNEEVVVFSNNTGTTFSNPINFTKSLTTESRVFSEGEILPSGQDIHIRLVKINNPEKENILHLYTIPKNFSKFRSDNFTADIASLGKNSKQRIVSLGNVIYTIYERVSSQRELVVASSDNGVIADLTILSNRLSGSYSYDPQIMSTLDGVMHVAWTDLSRGTNMQYNQDIFFAKNATDNTSVINLSVKMPKQAEYFAVDKLDVNYFDTNTAQPETEITKPKPKPVPMPIPIPEPYFEPNPETANPVILSPLAQSKSGIPANQIQCKKGLVLLLHPVIETPACVKPQTEQKLVQRGWIINKIHASDSVKQTTLPKFEIVGMNYVVHPNEPLIVSINKIGYDRCDSWNARIIDISDNSVVWERDSFNSCVVLDPPKQQKFEYRVSNEYRPIVVSKVGNYVFQITIDGTHLEKEFIVRNNTSGASLERIAYPTITISSTKHDPNPNSIILQIGVNNTTYWKNESELPVTLISEDGRWSSGLIPPNDGKIIQFNQTAFYEYDGHPQTAINGRIAILSDQTQFLPIREKLAIAREIIKVDMGPPITAIGIGNADNVLAVKIHENELKKNPDAEKFYTKKYRDMIPFEVPIRITFGHIEAE